MTIQSLENQDIQSQAQHWLNIMHGDELNIQQMQAFRSWLSSDQCHRDIYRTLELNWRLTAFSTLAEEALSQQQKTVSPHSNQKYWKVRFGSACTLATLLFVVLFTTFFQKDNITIEHYRAGLQNIETILLADGSSVTLGAGSHISTEFSNDHRRIKLISGEALFDVVHNKEKPFEILLARSKISVLGTVFDVQRRSDGYKVSVQKGSVSVQKNSQSISLQKNMAINVVNGRPLPNPVSIESSQFAAWRKKHFSFNNERLGDVISLLNRYHDKDIRLENPALGDLRFTGAMQLDQLEYVLSAMQYSHNLKSRTLSDGSIVIFRSEDSLKN